MNLLLLIDLASLDLTWRDIAVGGVAFILGLAGLLKALKDIKTDGWQPFKEKVVAWFSWRRIRREQTDALMKSVGDIKVTLAGIKTELVTNGGSSLKDKVIGIEEKVGHIQARIKHQDETSETPIFELDARGRLTFANCSFRELVDADEDELSHRDYISRLQPDDKTRFIRELAEAIENNMPIDSTVRFRVHKDQFAAIRLLANPNVRSGGDLLGFFGTASRVETAQ